MNFRQLLTAPNQLTLLRMVFLPFIVNDLVDHHYRTALILFVIAGITDGFDGLLARRLHQQTLIGEYLDPIADKLLLSTMFLVLAILHLIKWKFTIVVFSRDIGILLVSAVLYMAAGLRNFRPSIFGKINTLCQIGAVFFVLLYATKQAGWIHFLQLQFLRLTFTFTIASGVHYVFLVTHRLRELHHQGNTTGTPGVHPSEVRR